MSKSKEILQKKAKGTETLQESLDEGNKQSEISNSQSPRKIKTVEGKEVLVFEDPLHSKENRSVVNYSIF